MRISIQHNSRYKYRRPPDFLLQKARLTPVDGDRQSVVEWQIDVTGAHFELESRDAFGNRCTLLRADPGSELVEILARGTVDTENSQGLMEKSAGPMPLFVYLQESPLTHTDRAIADLADKVRRDDTIDTMHRLMDAIAERMEYVPGSTDVATTAMEALVAGKGVCQDFTHLFLAAARHLGVPARYTSGYFLSGNDLGGDASHGWAEAFVPNLGWIGFDPTNRRCPDERYVRIAAGRDYTDVSPISGVRVGAEGERLTVRLAVEQQ